MNKAKIEQLTKSFNTSSWSHDTIIQMMLSKEKQCTFKREVILRGKDCIIDSFKIDISLFHLFTFKPLTYFNNQLIVSIETK